MKKVTKEDQVKINSFKTNISGNSAAIQALAEKYGIACGCNASTTYTKLIDYMRKNSE